MSGSDSHFNIAIVTGSQRSPRAGDQIASWIESILRSNLPSHPTITLESIDIAALDLPLFDESGIPQKITSPSDYDHEHTRRWSRLVSRFHAFVFVSPQYNWGIPAGLKNAIDYLFNEWTGKSAMVVTYGGHGGDKCDNALRVVLGGGLKMQVVERRVNLAFRGREMLGQAAKGKDLDIAGTGVWAEKEGDVVAAWKELVELVQAPDTERTVKS